MLPGVGGLEYVVIAMLALVVIGPKDLPMLMRKAGAAINRLRGMAAEFRASFDEMARQSELDELRKQVEELRSGQLMQPIADEIAPAMTQIDRDVRASLSGDDWTGTGAGATPLAAPETPAAKSRARKAKATNGAKPPAKAPTKAAPAKAAPAKAASRKAPAAKPAAKPATTAKPAPKPAPKATPAKAQPAPKAKPAAKARPRARTAGA